MCVSDQSCSVNIVENRIVRKIDFMGFFMSAICAFNLINGAFSMIYFAGFKYGL